MIIKSVTTWSPLLSAASRAPEDPPASLLFSYCNCCFSEELAIYGPDSFLSIGVPGPQAGLVPLPVLLRTDASVEKGGWRDCAQSYVICSWKTWMLHII